MLVKYYQVYTTSKQKKTCYSSSFKNFIMVKPCILFPHKHLTNMSRPMPFY